MVTRAHCIILSRTPLARHLVLLLRVASLLERIFTMMIQPQSLTLAPNTRSSSIYLFRFHYCC